MAGNIVGMGVQELAHYIKSWNNFEAAVTLAAINSALNTEERVKQLTGRSVSKAHSRNNQSVCRSISCHRGVGFCPAHLASCYGYCGIQCQVAQNLCSYVGPVLATFGEAYQGMFKNPLMSPDILGASAGGVGSCLGYLFFFQLFWDSVELQHGCRS